jgi:hypothetical protein
MSTTARKARKRAGIKAPIKPAKVPTPVDERSFVTVPPYRNNGDAIPLGYDYLNAPRSAKRIKKFIESGGTAS